MKITSSGTHYLGCNLLAIFSCYCALLVTGCGGGPSGPPPDTTPPTTPTNLMVTAISSSQINLSWQASTDDVSVTGYKVERCLGPSCSNFVQIGAPASNAFSDMGLTASATYSYRVRATDGAGNLSPYSTVGAATTLIAIVSISVSPVRGGAAVGQTLTVTANLTNDTQVVWSAPGGGTLTGQAATTTSFSASSPGLYTVTATSVADPSKSATATLGVTDLAGVFTYHNNTARDGANTHEFALTTTNVATATFGKLFSCIVDGAIYAQPLWVPNVTIGSVKHNVVIVATQHDSVYAFDADASPCTKLWQVSLIDIAHAGTAGETSVPSGPAGNLVGGGFGDITPEVGITGTPVIDPATNTLYVVSKSVVAAVPIPLFFQRFHALSLIDGTEKFTGPNGVSASVPGTGDGGSTVTFNLQTEGQRAGLALVNGVVYVCWASHEDNGTYHGWVISYSASTMARMNVYNDSPNGRQGGIWMAGGAPAVDARDNSLYVITGNGDYDGTTDFGDSILRLSSTLGLKDSFTPGVQSTLDTNDLDLGSGGAMVLVDLPGAPAGFQHLLIGGGKGPGLNGELYVADRDNLGQFSATDTGIVQEFPLGKMIFSTPAFWNNTLYAAGAGGPLSSFSLGPTLGQFTNTGTPGVTSTTFGFPGATPSVSAQGTTNGIVWAIDSSQYCTRQSPNCGPAVLHAYNAANLSSELWNSSQAAGTRDKAGLAVKFTVPTVANGKVYIGTRGNDTTTGPATIAGELDVYGLLPN